MAAPLVLPFLCTMPHEVASLRHLRTLVAAVQCALLGSLTNLERMLVAQAMSGLVQHEAQRRLPTIWRHVDSSPFNAFGSLHSVGFGLIGWLTGVRLEQLNLFVDSFT